MGPFILGAAVVGVGMLGIAKGIKGVLDSNEANNIQEKAEKILKRAKENVELQKEETAFILKKLGEKKLGVSSKELKEFLYYINQIKNIKLSDVLNENEIKHFNFNVESLRSLEYVSTNAVELMKLGTGNLCQGTLLTWGSYSAIGALALATDNVTGFSGAAVLIAGGIFGAAAEEKLNSAKSNLSEAKILSAKLKISEIELECIKNIALEVNELLLVLKKCLVEGNEKLASILNKNLEWSKYSKMEKETIVAVLKVAQGMKIILDTPILNEDGSITNKVKSLTSDNRD